MLSLMHNTTLLKIRTNAPAVVIIGMEIILKTSLFTVNIERFCLIYCDTFLQGLTANKILL